MIHAFQGCELDEALFQLRRDGAVVKLEPRAFDVLLYLLRHRDRVVGKDELLREVWADAAVSESVLPGCVTAVRRAVGDDRARGRVIQTVHGRGYRFVAPVQEAPAAPPQRPAVRAAPFVGREGAMERLRAALASARAGRGRLLLLVGEPGIGKTRTAEELAATARREGARVFTGRCHEGEGAPAFWPWIRVLRELAHESAADALAADAGQGAAELAALVPELRAHLEPLAPSPVADAEASRFRLFDSVVTFLRRAGARAPLVLVLDDLHWADEASLRLLQFLAAELADAPLLVVGTYRDMEVRRGLPLADVLGALAREPHCERVPLRGLGASDVARFVEALLGRADERLAGSVWEMTEGNPFFIQEIVGVLAGEGGAPGLPRDGSAELALPQSVRDAIGRRLDALSRACDGLLRVAAVLGREFAGALLERVAELSHRVTLELLDEAVASGLLVESGEGVGRYAFHHALVRQTLYDELEIPERVRLHRRAGEALEAACGARVEPHLAELAHHFFQAAVGGSADEAVRYCTLAAERAGRSLAWEEAARLFERALQALDLQPPVDEVRRSELLLAHGEACWTSGDRDRAQAGFAAAAEIARRLGDVTLLARAAASSRLYDMGSPPEGATRELVEEALAALGDDHPVLRSRLLSRLAGMPPYSDSMERRDVVSREAHALAAREDDPEALRDALLARGYACLGPDRIDERFEVSRELFALSERTGDPGLAALGQDGLHVAHLKRGEIREADRALAAYARIAEELRHPFFLHYALTWQGSRALARADFERAEQLIRAAYERGRRVQAYAHFMYAGQMFILRSLRGDAEGSEEERVFFGEMMELPYAWVPAIRVSRAQRLVYEGDLDAASRLLDELVREVRDLPRDEHWLQSVGATAELSADLGDTSHGALLYELLEPYADLFMVHDTLRNVGGSVACALGSLASLLGRDAEALAHFEHAIAACAAADAPISVLDGKAALALHLVSAQRRDARERGLALRDEVLAGCRSLGIAGNRRIGLALDRIAARVGET